MTEYCSCWLLERDGCEDRYFGSLYPALAEEYDSMEASIIFWKVLEE